MNRLLFFTSIIVLFNCGCHSSTNEEKQIDYGQLKEIKVKLTMEIGGEEEHIFGGIRDLILTSNETLLVSDSRKHTIEQFNKDGTHRATVAREGNGPGELPDNFSLVDGGGDTLIVEYSGSPRRDYFGPNSEGEYAYIRSEYQERDAPLVSFIGSESGSPYFAMSSSITIARDLPEYKQTPVVLVDEMANILKDSLHMLKTPNSLFGNPGQYSTGITIDGLAFLGTPPYRYQDRFRLMDDGRYLIARPDSGALFVYNKDHELTRRISLHVKDRPVKSSDLDYALRNSSSKVRQTLEDYVDDIKPPYLNVWLSDDHIWLHTDESEKGRQIVLLTMEGNPLGKFLLSDIDYIQEIEGNRIYTLHRNPSTGHRIRVYEVDLTS